MFVHNSRCRPLYAGYTRRLSKNSNTKAIRVPQIAAAILFRDVIWHKAYCVSFKELKKFNFLASTDIKAFGHTCLLLIGLTLFYSQGVFV